MATLSRPQLVLKSMQEDGQDLTHTTLQVTYTGDEAYGTLLKADGTVATATELAEATWDVAYVIDDYRILDQDIEVGDVLTLRVVKAPQFLILRSSLLKLSGVALSDAEVLLYVAGSKVIDVQA